MDRAGDTVLERAAGWGPPGAPGTDDGRHSTGDGERIQRVHDARRLSLAADGTLPLTTRARELLGADLPLADDRVTVEHC